MVDDEEPFTRSLKRVLERDGPYEVHTVARAQEAVYIARCFRPDMIFLDLIMPDGDGGQVAGELLEDPLLRHVPIVFLTAAVKSSELEENAGMIGGRLYLAKPVTAEQLMAWIQHTLA